MDNIKIEIQNDFIKECITSLQKYKIEINRYINDNKSIFSKRAIILIDNDIYKYINIIDRVNVLYISMMNESEDILTMESQSKIMKDIRILIEHLNDYSRKKCKFDSFHIHTKTKFIYSLKNFKEQINCDFDNLINYLTSILYQESDMVTLNYTDFVSKELFDSAKTLTKETDDKIMKYLLQLDDKKQLEETETNDNNTI